MRWIVELSIQIMDSQQYKDYGYDWITKQQLKFKGIMSKAKHEEDNNNNKPHVKSETLL